jgi:hypothetical protein
MRLGTAVMYKAQCYFFGCAVQRSILVSKAAVVLLYSAQDQTWKEITLEELMDDAGCTVETARSSKEMDALLMKLLPKHLSQCKFSSSITFYHLL